MDRTSSTKMDFELEYEPHVLCISYLSNKIFVFTLYFFVEVVAAALTQMIGAWIRYSYSHVGAKAFSLFQSSNGIYF